MPRGQARLPDGRLPRGQAVATTAGRLPARWVVHTAGPIWSASEDRSEVLRSCYRESLRLADELGARTVAFPAISAGIYGWPIDDAARQAVAGVRAASPDHVVEVQFVLFDDRALAAFERALVSERRALAVRSMWVRMIASASATSRRRIACTNSRCSCDPALAHRAARRSAPPSAT